MPDEERIRNRIDIVLQSEITAYGQNGRLTGHLGSFNVTMQNLVVRTNRVQSFLSDATNHNQINSRSAAALLRLHSSLNTSGKDTFKNTLRGVIDSNSPYQNLSYLAYFVLYRIGDKIEPLRFAFDRLHQDVAPNFGFGNTLAMVSNILTFEYDQFSEEELDELNNILGDQPANGDFFIRDKIREAKMRLLEGELGEVNPEINSDRDKVITFWERVFGTQSVPNLINQIEDLFNEGAFDEAKLATCLGRVRVLLINAQKELAAKLADTRGLTQLAPNAEDATVINWFKEQDFLTSKEKKIIRAMYDLCSDEGSHADVSKREYARVAKNVTYECLIMLIGLLPE